MSLNRLVRIIVPVVVLFTMVYSFNRTNGHPGTGQNREISYSQFVDAINANDVQDGSLGKRYFRGHFTRGSAAFTASLPPENSQEYTLLIQRLQAHGVRYGFARPALSDNLVGMVASVVLPLVLIFFFWTFFLRQARRNGVGSP